jgi:hypothetical protein
MNPLPWYERDASAPVVMFALGIVLLLIAAIA